MIFRRRENFLDGPKIFQKLDRLDAVDFVQKSSKSELSSRFSGRLKFLAVFADCAVQCQQKRKNKKRNFLANSADRPRIYIETLYKSNVPRDVCLNSPKSGGLHFLASLVAIDSMGSMESMDSVDTIDSMESICSIDSMDPMDSMDATDSIRSRQQ